MENNKENLMNELLTHRYSPFYLTHPDRLGIAEELHQLGYFDIESGRITDKAQDYFNQLYEDRKDDLLKEIRLFKSKKELMTYNQISNNLGYADDTYFLFYFLHKLNNLGAIAYREGKRFDSELRIKILDLSKA